MSWVAMLLDWIGLNPNEMKLSLMTATGLAKDALHIYFGMTLFLLVALLRQRRLASKLAWLSVLLLALAGELVDYAMELRGQAPVNGPEHWHDIWNSLAWPTILFLLAHVMRLSPERGTAQQVDGPSGQQADQSFE